MSLFIPESSAPKPDKAEGPGFPVYEPSDPFKDVKKAERDRKREEASREGRELLFTIDGVDFFMPKNPSVQSGFKLLRDIRREGQLVAAANYIAEVIGEDCLDALADTKSMTNEDWEVVGGILADKVFSRMQDPMGKGS